MNNKQFLPCYVDIRLERSHTSWKVNKGGAGPVLRGRYLIGKLTITINLHLEMQVFLLVIFLFISGFSAGKLNGNGLPLSISF